MLKTTAVWLALTFALLFGGSDAAAQDSVPSVRKLLAPTSSGVDYLQDTRISQLGVIPIPPPPHGAPPAVVRGLYLNAWLFGSSSRLNKLVALADTTEINSFVIDVKDGTGYLTYRSSVPTALEIGANNEPRARNVREKLAKLLEHGSLLAPSSSGGRKRVLHPMGHPPRSDRSHGVRFRETDCHERHTDRAGAESSS